MGVLAPAREQVRAPVARQWPLYAGVALYATAVGATIIHHEPWTDEAQSWLLARDSNLVQLWTNRLRYEGTPGLWHTLLYLVIRAGLPYRAIGIVSGILGCGAAWLAICRFPFPRAVRLLLPFSFFLLYQYGVIARSYSLLPILLFACAAAYLEAPKRPVQFAVLLSLLAAVSVHGFALSVAITAATTLRLFEAWPALASSERIKILICGAGYVLMLALAAFCAWPPGDGTFVTAPWWSFDHFLDVSGKMLRDAFTGETVFSAAVVAVSLPFLWRGRALGVFIVSALLLCGIGAVIHAQVWHYGILFLAWLFALWIAGARIPATWPVIAALVVTCLIQCYWTVGSIRYDWQALYSASGEAASFLKKLNSAPNDLYAIGYSTTAIQPYFKHNIFGNYQNGRESGYWDWSTANHVNRDAGHLSTLRPRYVMVGYKTSYERMLWRAEVESAGYSRKAHFEGNLFWQMRILEPESYDFYERLKFP